MIIEQSTTYKKASVLRIKHEGGCTLTANVTRYETLGRDTNVTRYVMLQWCTVGGSSYGVIIEQSTTYKKASILRIKHEGGCALTANVTRYESKPLELGSVIVVMALELGKKCAIF